VALGCGHQLCSSAWLFVREPGRGRIRIMPN
jgi:hypothetical protein